ncbi:hypothetical protein [Komagataeibacter xylinus]|nr:hypothetical protein [Komagataeibacter xylinus]
MMPRCTPDAMADRDAGMHGNVPPCPFPTREKTGTTAQPIALQQRV